jgi:hypothetical protein
MVAGFGHVRTHFGVPENQPVKGESISLLNTEFKRFKIL